MVAHLVDTAALRRRNLHHEADALEAVTAGHDPSPLPAGHSTAQAGGERPATVAAREAGSGGAGAAQGSWSPSGSDGGAGGPGASREGGGAGAEAGGGGGGQGGSPVEAAEAPEPPGHDPHMNPLAGLSDHLAEHIQRLAFRHAGADAQDSEIARRAEALLPPELRALARHPEPQIDASPVARKARLAALHGDVPAWTRSEPTPEQRTAPAAPAAQEADFASRLVARFANRREANSDSEMASDLASGFALNRDSRPESALETGAVRLREPGEASSPTSAFASRLAARAESVLDSVSESQSASGSEAKSLSRAPSRDNDRER